MKIFFLRVQSQRVNILARVGLEYQCMTSFNCPLVKRSLLCLDYSYSGLGFNGVVIDLQQHFETYPNYQILPKFTNKIYDNVADFRQLRAVESQPWMSFIVYSSHTHRRTQLPSQGIITGKRVMNFSDTTHECPCVEQMLTMHCSLAGPRAAIAYHPWPDCHEMKIIPTVETG